MNDSNNPAIPAPVFDCDFIQAAHLRVVQMHASAAHPVEAPTLLELEQALGEPVKKCESSWRAAILRWPNKPSGEPRRRCSTNTIS